MAFNVKVEDFEVLQEGTYDATFVDIEECESANPAFAGGYWKWEFEILRDGEPRRMTANSSAKLTRMTKAGAWVRAIRGRPVDAREDFSFGAIRGRPCRLVLTIEDTKVGQFNGIDEILPPTKEQAQQRVPVSQAPSDAPF